MCRQRAYRPLGANIGPPRKRSRSMPEYRFSCPSCGQHFSGDFGYCGLQMTCPACSNQFVVPNPGSSAPVASATAPRAQRTTVALPARLPLRPPAQATPAPIAPRTSGWAVASLICSLLGLLIFPCLVAGIVCGHIAMRRLASDPTLQGRGFAKAGLVIGYVVLVLAFLAVIGILVLGLSFARLHG